MNYIIPSTLLFLALLSGCAHSLSEEKQQELRVTSYWIGFGKQLARQENLIYLNSGFDSPFPIKDFLKSLMFAAKRPLELNEARKLALNTHQTLWSWMCSNLEFERYYETLASSKYNNYQLPYGPEYVAFRITVWDPEYERYPAPSVSQILVYHNRIEYSYLDPETGGLQPPIVETIAEAQQKIQR